MASYTTTLQCVADTYVNGGDGATYGAASQLKVGGYYSGTPTRKRSAAIVGFDISSIPANKVIKKLTLNISAVSFSVYYINDYDTEVDPVLRDSHIAAYPFVLKARTALGYTNGEINNLNYSGVTQKTFNPFASANWSHDSSLSLANKQGQTVSIDIGMIGYSTDENGNQIVSLKRPDNNIVTALLIQDNAFSTGGYGTAAFFAQSPTLTVTYEDYVPAAPFNLNPSATTRNKNGSINLAWEFSDNGTGALQGSAEVVYSTDGFVTSTTKLVSGNQNYYTIAANTFSVGQTVQWKVRVTDTNGDISSYSSIASFTIGATLPSTPELISPFDTVVNSSDIINFKWKFIDNYGYVQGGFDFAYAKVGEVETVIHVNTSTPQYAMPKDTLLGGNYKWRVRTYNQFGEVGPYSDYKTVYSIGKPNAPVISSVSNNCRPVITWSATEQDLFVIRILFGGIELYNSGEQTSGPTNEFKIPTFLQNGTYTAAIKTSNVYGFWSNETTYNFTINTVAPTKPNIVVSVTGNSSSIVIDSSTQANIIYRKSGNETSFTEVAEVESNIFTDYKVHHGDNQYFVRSISQDSFIDSDIKTVTLEFDGIILSNENDLSLMVNLKNTMDSDKRKSIALSRDSYRVNCVGRTYPISQRTEFQNYSESHEYFLKETEFDTFVETVQDSNIVYYRSHKGFAYYAEITNISIQENPFGYVTIFTLTRLDRS